MKIYVTEIKALEDAHISSRRLLADALEKVYGVSLNSLSVQKNEFGKPYFENSDIYFNISHSANIAVLTVADTECGVDIENTAKPHEAMGVANRFFSRNEYAAMMLSANPNEAFCRLWTLRESYVKMRGKGFAIGLSTLKCDFHRGVCMLYQDGIQQTDACFKEFRDVYGYRISVCTQGIAEHSISEWKL